MFLRGSRYRRARTFTGAAEAIPAAMARPRAIGAATGILEHTVGAGDRLDLLARHYYNDDRLWWRIVDANPEFFYGGEVVQEKTLVKDGDEIVEQEPPAAGAPVLAAGMVGRVILIPKARN